MEKRRLLLSRQLPGTSNRGHFQKVNKTLQLADSYHVYPRTFSVVEPNRKSARIHELQQQTTTTTKRKVFRQSFSDDDDECFNARWYQWWMHIPCLLLSPSQCKGERCFFFGGVGGGLPLINPNDWSFSFSHLTLENYNASDIEIFWGYELWRIKTLTFNGK